MDCLRHSPRLEITPKGCFVQHCELLKMPSQLQEAHGQVNVSRLAIFAGLGSEHWLKWILRHARSTNSTWFHVEMLSEGELCWVSI